MFKLKTLIVIF